MHSCILDSKDPAASRQHILYASEQYTVALGETRRLLLGAAPSQIHRILMVCLLFVAWEGIQGDYQASQRHMDSGRALIARFGRQISAKASLSGVVHEITEVLARMDISAISFSDDSAPYNYSPHESLGSGLSEVSGAFTNIRQASSQLMEITRMLLRVGREFALDGDAAEQKRRQDLIDEGAKHLEIWEAQWVTWCSENMPSPDSLSVLNIQLWRACIKTTIATGFCGPETRYDSATDMFREVISHAEKVSLSVFQDSEPVSFSLELGYLIPTFFVATRCRDPRTRRRALAILRSYPRHEGAWQSGPAAVIAEKWMQVEERELGEVEDAAQIPELGRVVTMHVQVQKNHGRARLGFHLSGTVDGPAIIEEVVTF